MKRRIAAMIVANVIAAGTLFPGEKQHTIQRLGDGDLILVRTKVRFTTLIVLPDGEEISEVTCGDKEYWVIEGKGSNVHVKPAKEGATTNLNVVSKSKAVYSFLLEEISGSKARPSKAKPDLIVRVDQEEVSQLRKDKNDLADLLSRTERELKEQKDRAAEAERKRLQRKEEPPPAPKKEPEVAKAVEPSQQSKPVVAEQRVGARPQLVATASDPAHFTTYKVERNGILSTSGRAVGQVLRKVGRFLRLF